MPSAPSLTPEPRSYLAANHQRYLDELFAFVRIPSVSAQPSYRAERQRCAGWLAERFRDAGLANVALLEADATATAPLVYGDWLEARGKPTVLVYGHYDVQPPEPLEEWETPPFEPTIVGQDVRGRGSADDKGQVLPFVNAVEALLKLDGRLPVNVKFIVEGDEEVSSPALLRFLTSERGRRLLASDVVVVSDGTSWERGRPSIIYSMRGACYLELRVDTARSDLHSGIFGGGVANAASIVADLLASLHDADLRVSVPGFYDEVPEPDPDERRHLAGLGLDEVQWLAQAGRPAARGEAGYSTLERIWLRPILEICGVWGGYSGAGLKTIVPARAGAKIGGRLVGHQNPYTMMALVEGHLRSRLPVGVRLEVELLSAADPVRVDPNTTWLRATREAFAEAFGMEPLLGCSGATVPILPAFQRELSAALVLLGLAPPDSQAHAPNERMDLRTYLTAGEAIIGMLSRFADPAAT